jgi:hypothetical protein
VDLEGAVPVEEDLEAAEQAAAAVQAVPGEEVAAAEPAAAVGSYSIPSHPNCWRFSHLSVLFFFGFQQRIPPLFYRCNFNPPHALTRHEK